MMRTILVVSLVLLVACSFGCSKKKEEAPKPEAQQVQQADTVQAGTVISTIDPVTKEEVDGATPYKYEYNGVVYLFSTAENMEAFKADPAKYLTQ